MRATPHTGSVKSLRQTPTFAATGGSVDSHTSAQCPLAPHQNGPTWPRYSPVRCAISRKPSIAVLNRHAAAALDGVDLARERVEAGALALVEKELQFVVGDADRDLALDEIDLLPRCRAWD